MLLDGCQANGNSETRVYIVLSLDKLNTASHCSSLQNICMQGRC